MMLFERVLYLELDPGNWPGSIPAVLPGDGDRESVTMHEVAFDHFA